MGDEKSSSFWCCTSNRIAHHRMNFELVFRLALHLFDSKQLAGQPKPSIKICNKHQILLYVCCRLAQKSLEEIRGVMVVRITQP